MQHVPQHTLDQAQINRLAVPAQQYLGDCSRVLVFTGDGQVLFSESCQVCAMLLLCKTWLQNTWLQLFSRMFNHIVNATLASQRRRQQQSCKVCSLYLVPGRRR